MIIHKIPVGFKINKVVLTENTFFQKHEIKTIVQLIDFVAPVEGGEDIVEVREVTHPIDILNLWSIDELNNIGINKIFDNSYDTNQFDLTGTFNDVLQEDGTFVRDYTNSLTEKSDYINTLRQIKKGLVDLSFNEKIEEGYTHDPNGLSINMKCDLQSVQSLAFTSENIGKGKVSTLRVKKKDKMIHTGMVKADVSSMFDDIKDYYLLLLDKKFEHEDIINNADKTTLDSLTTFDFSI